MAIRTLYACDHCKKEQDNSEDMYGVAILVTDDPRKLCIGGYGYSTMTMRSNEVHHGSMWCKVCIQRVGLAFVPSPKAPGITPPSLEDMIREIATETALEVIKSR